MFRDIFDCHNYWSTYGTWYGEARGAAEYPTMSRIVPPAKNRLASNVRSAQEEKLFQGDLCDARDMHCPEGVYLPDTEL